MDGNGITIYALLKRMIQAVGAAVTDLQPGYTFQGSVSSATDLPATATKGDMYIVTGENNAEYVYDGSDWLPLSSIRVTGVNN